MGIKKHFLPGMGFLLPLSCVAHFYCKSLCSFQQPCLQDNTRQLFKVQSCSTVKVCDATMPGNAHLFGSKKLGSL